MILLGAKIAMWIGGKLTLRHTGWMIVSVKFQPKDALGLMVNVLQITFFEKLAQ